MDENRLVCTRTDVMLLDLIAFTKLYLSIDSELVNHRPCSCSCRDYKSIDKKMDYYRRVSFGGSRNSRCAFPIAKPSNLPDEYYLPNKRVGKIIMVRSPLLSDSNSTMCNKDGVRWRCWNDVEIAGVKVKGICEKIVRNDYVDVNIYTYYLYFEHNIANSRYRRKIKNTLKKQSNLPDDMLKEITDRVFTKCNTVDLEAEFLTLLCQAPGILT